MRRMVRPINQGGIVQSCTARYSAVSGIDRSPGACNYLPGPGLFISSFEGPLPAGALHQFVNLPYNEVLCDGAEWPAIAAARFVSALLKHAHRRHVVKNIVRIRRY